MPFGSITLQPGVNVERTPTLLRAGVSQSALIRYRDSLIQKLGGWKKFYPFNVAGIPRDLHAWKDLNDNNWLAVGTTTSLGAIANNTLNTITPQQLVSDFVPNISTTINSPLVTIVDPNISNVTIEDSVFFDVPVSQGGLILDGLYQITTITGTHSYQITAASNATTTETNPTATNGTTAIGNNTLHFASTPAWIVAGIAIADITASAAIPSGTTVVSTTGTTVVMSANAVSPGVGSGDSIVFASIPIFTTATGSANVSVRFIAHRTVVGDTVVFPVATTGNGITIHGSYEVISVADANNFSIATTAQASGTSSFAMNGGLAEITYFIALGPPASGTGYGIGGYGLGGYGTGTTPTVQTGTPITATDWTDDNWGGLLVSCPRGGGIYFWDPLGGFQNSQIVSTAPPLNNGIFVSTLSLIHI